jgi:hypothetical protein
MVQVLLAAGLDFLRTLLFEVVLEAVAAGEARLTIQAPRLAALAVFVVPLLHPILLLLLVQMLLPTKAAAVGVAPTPQQQPAWPAAMVHSLVAAVAPGVDQTMATTPALAATAALALSVSGAGNYELRNSQRSRPVHQPHSVGWRVKLAAA